MKVGVFLFFIFYSFFSLAQKENALKHDSLNRTISSNENVKNDSVKKHSVLKAALFSAIIPGAGQIYNHIAMPKGKKKAFWKVPLIYAGLGATGYLMIKQQTLQKSLKTEYKYRESSGFTAVKDPKWQEYDETSVLALYQKHLNQRDLLIIGFGVVYLLQVADAAVEAHFVNFDISENLSLQFRPTIIPSTYALPTPGLKLALKLKR